MHLEILTCLYNKDIKNIADFNYTKDKLNLHKI